MKALRYEAEFRFTFFFFVYITILSTWRRCIRVTLGEIYQKHYGVRHLDNSPLPDTWRAGICIFVMAPPSAASIIYSALNWFLVVWGKPRPRVACRYQEHDQVKGDGAQGQEWWVEGNTLGAEAAVPCTELKQWRLCYLSRCLTPEYIFFLFILPKATLIHLEQILGKYYNVNRIFKYLIFCLISCWSDFLC